MTSNAPAQARSPISQLFAAALDGDQRATRVLQALADEDSTATLEDAVDAEDALRALGRPVPDNLGEKHGTGEDVKTEELGRVWATG